MYITKATIIGLEETASYPIAVAVMQDMQYLFSKTKNVPIRIGENPPLYITKDSNSKNTHVPDILNEEIAIEYDETSREDYDVALTALSPIANYIYNDTDVRSSIKPLLTRRRMVYNVTYYNKSKSMVTRIINSLKARTPADTRHMIHDLEYSYDIPVILIELLDMINTLKNTHTVPPVDLDDYIANTFTRQSSITNSETGNPLKSTLAIRERQLSVLGTIDTDLNQLEKELDESSNRWFFNLEYSIEYELPTQLLVTYPITIYNQPIYPKFRIKKPAGVTYSGDRTSDSDGLVKLTTREPELLRIPTTEYYLKLPTADTLELPAPLNSYVRLFSVISTVEVGDPTMLFYLDEVPNVAFKNDVMELIKLEASRMGHSYTSIFYIDLYNHDERVYNNDIVVTVVTEDVNGVPTERVMLRTTNPLDIKGSYRVSFNVLSELAVLRTGAINMLKDNIATVDNASSNDFSVIDSVMGILDLDISKLRTGYQITDDSTSIEIAMNISNDLWHRVFTKQVSLILTEMLDTK